MTIAIDSFRYKVIGVGFVRSRGRCETVKSSQRQNDPQLLLSTSKTESRPIKEKCERFIEEIAAEINLRPVLKGD
jgi:hypothetical protein